MLRRATNLTRIHFTADHFSCMPYALLESVYSGFRGKVQIVVPNRNLLHALGSAGRPPIPVELRALIRRIANELLLKIGTRVSPRTVNKYLPRRPQGRPRGDTIRRECLERLIPLSECHLRRILKSWIPHYNSGRPHMGAGSRCSRSAAHQSLPRKSKFAPSSRLLRTTGGFNSQDKIVLERKPHAFHCAPAGRRTAKVFFIPSDQRCFDAEHDVGVEIWIASGE
jgi:hypothetical protein